MHVHPLTLTRGALAVEVEEFARSHSGRVWAGLVGRVVEDVVGVEAVRENERGVAEIVQLQLLPNYTRALERLYVLTRQLQRSAVIPKSVQRLSARPMQEVLDAFALDLLLTHPEFPASFRSTVYYLIRQNNSTAYGTVTLTCSGWVEARGRSPGRVGSHGDRPGGVASGGGSAGAFEARWPVKTCLLVASRRRRPTECAGWARRSG